MDRILKIFLLLCLLPYLAQADSVEDLARDFWAWRATEQPSTSDDIVRIERPANWVPNWSPKAVADYREQLDIFEARWKKLRDESAPIPSQVDYRLMGSAIARVRWELYLTRSWEINPTFYLDQTLAAYTHLLLDPSPFSAERTRAMVATLRSIPLTLENGKKNLNHPVAPFAHLAIDQLENAGSKLAQSVQELKPHLDPTAVQGLDKAAQNAVSALQSYRDWLKAGLPTMSSDTAIDRESYTFFLKNVALLPYTPEQLLNMGKQEWGRAVSSQIYEEHRNQETPQLQLFKDQNEEIATQKKAELSIRRYLEEKNLLTIPAWVKHYQLAPMPSYLSSVSDITEADDFTSISRLQQNSTRYIDPPSPKLGYFALSLAEDPRALTVHEGVPDGMRRSIPDHGWR
jgi:Bacterial protein of unknown function (DUF885)